MSATIKTTPFRLALYEETSRDGGYIKLLNVANHSVETFLSATDTITPVIVDEKLEYEMLRMIQLFTKDVIHSTNNKMTYILEHLTTVVAYMWAMADAYSANPGTQWRLLEGGESVISTTLGDPYINDGKDFRAGVFALVASLVEDELGETFQS